MLQCLCTVQLYEPCFTKKKFIKMFAKINCSFQGAQCQMRSYAVDFSSQ
jgi:hypothetical protein